MTWTHKKLWLLGFLAGFLQIANVFEILFKTFNRLPEGDWNLLSFMERAYPGAALVPLARMWPMNFFRLTELNFWPILLVLAVIAFLIWLFSLAEGSLMLAASRLTKGGPNLRLLFSRVKPLAARIAGLHVLAKLLVAALLLGTSLPLFLLGQTTELQISALSFVLFLVFLTLALVASLMTIFAVAGLVLRQEKFFHALHRAWELTRSHFLVSFETATILFLVHLLAGFLIVLAALVLIITVSIFALGLSLAGFTTGSAILIFSAYFLVILLTFLVGAIVSTFQIITWTLLYERLQKGQVRAKLLRLIHSLPRFFHYA